MASVRRPAGVDAFDWDSLIAAVEEYRDTLALHRTDPGANAEPGMVAEDVANRCVRLLLDTSPQTSGGDT